MIKKLVSSTLVLGIAVMLSTAVQAAHILEVDLSVPGQVTITGTGNPAAADATGSDTTGVYLNNLYGAAGSALTTSSTGAGDLTNVGNPSDGSPALFRAGGGSDTGLNVWSWSSDTTVSFTAGQAAFSGSGTWALDPAEYDDMVNGMAAGDVYFPADDSGDIAGATVIGAYAVVVPEPASFGIISTLLIGLLGFRRR